MLTADHFERQLSMMLEDPTKWSLVATPKGRAKLTKKPDADDVVINHIYSKHHWLISKSRIVHKTVRDHVHKLKVNKAFSLAFFLKNWEKKRL